MNERQPASATKRVGLFGGSFDPVHLGHLAMARAARDAMRLDEIVWMVARASPLKGGANAPALDRLEMVKRAIRGEAGFVASDLEIRRGGVSYTIDTIEALKKVRPGAQIYCIFGSDSLQTFTRWRAAGQIVKDAIPVIVPREGCGKEVLNSISKALGADVAAPLEAGWLDVPKVTISSTEIRKKLLLGESLRDLVAPDVETYIHERGLYQESKI
ncbi:MAG: nicotinate-nucleotide adenylyltransferase [Planctomycetota bacterium]